MTRQQRDALGFLVVGAAVGVALAKSKTLRHFAFGVLATAATQAQAPKLPARAQVIEVQPIEIDVSDL